MEIVSLASGQGTARVATRAAGVMHVVFEGHLDVGLYVALRKVADVELARAGRLQVFFDSWDVHGFDPEFRQRMMAWQASTPGKVHQLILVRSKVVAVAVAAANRLIGGGAEITSNRDRWQRALDEAVAKVPVEARGGAVKLDD